MDGRKYYVYGDTKYLMKASMKISFKRITETPEQKFYNTEICSVSVTMEWN